VFTDHHRHAYESIPGAHVYDRISSEVLDQKEDQPRVVVMDLGQTPPLTPESKPKNTGLHIVTVDFEVDFYPEIWNAVQSDYIFFDNKYHPESAQKLIKYFHLETLPPSYSVLDCKAKKLYVRTSIQKKKQIIAGQAALEYAKTDFHDPTTSSSSSENE
jgi:hypothetical protein